jgi:hypothetical protein
MNKVIGPFAWQGKASNQLVDCHVGSVAEGDAKRLLAMTSVEGA